MAKCSKTVLTALRGAYGLTPARAATFIAAKAARVPHGQKGTMYARPDRLRFVRLIRPKARSLLRKMPHCHAAGRRRSRFAALAPPAAKDSSILFRNKICRQ